MAIFGKSSQSLSAAQGIQLALGVATLMDGGDGTLGDIRGALGVDVLSLDTDDDGEQEVNVGSYVADGVYVGAKQSLGGSSAVVVEVDILDNLTVDVETGSTAGESVGLNWKYDF
jgi:translocation and assembly module TamB